MLFTLVGLFAPVSLPSRRFLPNSRSVCHKSVPGVLLILSVAVIWNMSNPTETITPVLEHSNLFHFIRSLDSTRSDRDLKVKRDACLVVVQELRRQFDFKNNSMDMDIPQKGTVQALNLSPYRLEI